MKEFQQTILLEVGKTIVTQIITYISRQMQILDSNVSCLISQAIQSKTNNNEFNNNILPPS